MTKPEDMQKTLESMAGEIERLRSQLEQASKIYPKYFVLKPAGDDPYALASRKAMDAYAKEIEERDPDLWHWLRTWIIHENHQTSERRLMANFEGLTDETD